MAKSSDRFEEVYTQGMMTVTKILVDKVTGVNYVFHVSGYAGGLTPLLDREGKPVVSPVSGTKESFPVGSGSFHLIHPVICKTDHLRNLRPVFDGRNPIADGHGKGELLAVAFGF